MKSALWRSTDVPRTSILAHFTKCISTIFLKYSLNIPAESKKNWVYPFCHKFHSNSVLNWRLHTDVLGTFPDINFEHITQNTLLLYFFRSYFTKCVAWNTGKLVAILTVSKKRPKDVLRTSGNTSQGDVLGMSPWHQFWTSNASTFPMHCFQSYFTKCMPETLKS